MLLNAFKHPDDGCFQICNRWLAGNFKTKSQIRQIQFCTAEPVLTESMTGQFGSQILQEVQLRI